MSSGLCIKGKCYEMGTESQALDGNELLLKTCTKSKYDILQALAFVRNITAQLIAVI